MVAEPIYVNPDDDDVPDDVNGMPAASTVVALLIGLALGFGVAMWMTMFHLAGTGRVW